MADIQNPILQQLDLLLLGYGFNFYRAENRLRADDLLIRQKACADLGSAARRINNLAGDFQAQVIPPPTRENPYPPAELSALLGSLNSLAQRISNTAAAIQGLPTPTQDRIWRRLRDEKELLSRLLESDLAFIKQTVEIDRIAASLTVSEIKSPAAVQPLNAAIDELETACATRRRLLEIPT